MEPGLIEQVGKVLVYLLPMYVANASPTIFGGGLPIDLRRRHPDGRRILGDGKTFKGTAGGIVAGTGTAFLLEVLFPRYAALLTPNYVLMGFLLSVGALVGDMVASYFKRRHALPRGEPVLFLDQLDFVFGGVITASAVYVPSFHELLWIAVATLVIHRATNWVAYRLRLKNEPW